MSVEWILPHLIHIGAVLYLICFLFRDQIMLRSFAILGDFTYMAYYYTAAAEPLWSAIYWVIPSLGINFVMIWLIWRDRQMTTLNDDQLMLFQNLKGINPGQFRRLMKISTWKTLESAETLTVEGRPLDRLYYVLRGDVQVNKGDRSFKVDPAIFIGELAYLRKKPATATVKADAGSVMVSWSHEELDKIRAKDEGLANAIAAMLSNDMAEKVAKA